MAVFIGILWQGRDFAAKAFVSDAELCQCLLRVSLWRGNRLLDYMSWFAAEVVRVAAVLCHPGRHVPVTEVVLESVMK